MSSEPEELAEVARNIFGLVRQGFEIGTRTSNETVNDSLTVLGLDITASEQQINNRFRDLATLIHPDSSPYEDVREGVKRDAFILAQRAREYLIELEFEHEAEESAEQARRRTAPESPGTGGWGPFAQERQEQYRQTFQNVKVFFAEEFLGKTITAQSFDEAVRNGEISQQDINRIEDILRENFGVPELTLDDMARVLASLIVTGSIRMGNVDHMVSEGIFERGGGVWGSGEDEIFDRSGGRGRGDIFR